MQNWLGRGLMFLLMTLGLGGCVALNTSPITLSVWFAIGTLFVVNPAMRHFWSRCSVIMAVLFVLIACYGFVSLVENYQNGWGSAKQNGQLWMLVLLGLVAGLAAWSTQRGDDGEAEDRTIRCIRVGIQIVAGSTVMGYWIYLLRYANP